jgi:hypothetical protein
LAILAGARLPARQATVSQAVPAEDMKQHARSVSPTVRRARLTRDASDARQ